MVHVEGSGTPATLIAKSRLSYCAVAISVGPPVLAENTWVSGERATDGRDKSDISGDIVAQALLGSPL
jgi:hypothetical protein